MSNSQSAHDVSAYHDDDGYGQIGVYSHHAGTVTATGDVCACHIFVAYAAMCTVCSQKWTPHSVSNIFSSVLMSVIIHSNP